MSIVTREEKLEKLLNEKLGVLKDKKGNFYKDHIQWENFLFEQKKLLNEYIASDSSTMNKKFSSKQERKNKKQRLDRLRKSILKAGIRKNIKKICDNREHIRADVFHFDAVPFTGRYKKFQGKICSYLLSAILKNDIDAVIKGIDSGLEILKASLAGNIPDYKKNHYLLYSAASGAFFLNIKIQAWRGSDLNQLLLINKNIIEPNEFSDGKEPDIYKKIQDIEGNFFAHFIDFLGIYGTKQQKELYHYLLIKTDISSKILNKEFLDFYAENEYEIQKKLSFSKE
jgi:hypothetical protein